MPVDPMQKTNSSRTLAPARRVSLVGLLLLGFVTVAAASPQAPDAVAAPPPIPSTTRIATIGASVSAGFGNAGELKTKVDVPLSIFLGALLADEKATAVTGQGDSWFFRDARKFGKRQVDDALDTSPTLVIGVDFLFWYAFGHSKASDPRRSKGLEDGLAELDRIACPIVIGDLPDVSHALHGKGPFGQPMIRRSMLPRDEERIAMNARIRAWAEARGDVAIVPLSVMTSRMVQGQPMAVRGNEWTVSDPRDALQSDLLHPTSRGAIWIALHIADAATRLEGVSEGAFVWDEASVQERVNAALEVSRQARAKKEKQRRERREKADHRREKSDKARLPC